jgi:hypothetical protein
MALPLNVGPTFLDDAVAELYEVPSGSLFHVKQLTLCNQDVGDLLVTFHNVAVAGSPTNANAFLHEAVIPAGETVQIDMDMAFDGTIQALCDSPDLLTAAIDGLLMDSADERGLFYRPRARMYLPDAEGLLWQADGLSMLKHIVVCNTDDVSHDFSLWRAEGASTDEMRFITRTLDAHTSFFMSVNMVMPDDAQLRGEADAASMVSIVASGVGATT